MLAENGVKDPWKLQVITGLAALSFAEVHRLVSEASTRNAEAVVAWTARNLLELKIWSAYAAKSESNLRRIFEDAGRDANEMYEFTKQQLSKSFPEDPLPGHIQAGQDRLKKRASLEGVDGLEQRYMRVNSAADEIGFGSDFRFHYKWLSKIAHPTAMRIVGTKTEQAEAVSRGHFFGLGCSFFSMAFTANESSLSKLAADDQSQFNPS